MHLTGVVQSGFHGGSIGVGHEVAAAGETVEHQGQIVGVAESVGEVVELLGQGRERLGAGRGEELRGVAQVLGPFSEGVPGHGVTGLPSGVGDCGAPVADHAPEPGFEDGRAASPSQGLGAAEDPPRLPEVPERGSSGTLRDSASGPVPLLPKPAMEGVEGVERVGPGGFRPLDQGGHGLDPGLGVAQTAQGAARPPEGSSEPSPAVGPRRPPETGKRPGPLQVAPGGVDVGGGRRSRSCGAANLVADGPPQPADRAAGGFEGERHRGSAGRVGRRFSGMARTSHRALESGIGMLYHVPNFASLRPRKETVR